MIIMTTAFATTEGCLLFQLERVLYSFCNGSSAFRYRKDYQISCRVIFSKHNNISVS